MEIRDKKQKIRFYVGLIQLHNMIKMLVSNYHMKREAYFMMLVRYFRAFRLQRKYLRNILKFGPDMEVRAT